MKYLCSFLLPLVLLLSAQAQQTGGGTVLTVHIIRHGEKPAKGDNLSCEGQYRALKLADVLTKKIGKPDYTYVPTLNTGKHTTSVRMFQTVTPFAIKHNLHVDSKYAETDSTGAAANVLKRRGMVLMVWEHGNIPPLARALGVPAGEVPAQWGKNDFDSIWTITYTVAENGTLQVANFDTSGKEGIKPPACK